MALADWRFILSTYENEVCQRLGSWHDSSKNSAMVETMAAHITGARLTMKIPGKLMRMFNDPIDRTFAAMCCGAYTELPYSGKLLSFLGKSAHGIDPAAFTLK